tara:strand:- start:4407 stop:5363 length:957 start_codon:yes stop_codon:yes gene_type:complete
MVKIQIDLDDPTLLAADQILEKRENSKPRRGYLGMSAGGNCARQNYYNFRGVQSKPFNAKTLKNFSSGHRAEPVMIKRIQQVQGLDVLSVDPATGKQFEVEDFDGHLLGHLDFEVLGLLQAPKTWHVGECKETSEKKLQEFRRIKGKVGEKNTLKAWNENYYAQHQLYMKYRKRKRGWLVVASAGVRDWDSCRTDYNREDADYYAEKARQIIYEPERIPDRIAEDPSYFKCSWCDYKAICFEREKPVRNCRTCVYGKPEKNRQWFCQKHKFHATQSEQREGCSSQRFLTALVDGSVKQITDDTIIYEMSHGEWIDNGD